jgi:hypothetical protein
VEIEFESKDADKLFLHSVDGSSAAAGAAYTSVAALSVGIQVRPRFSSPVTVR